MKELFPLVKWEGGVGGGGVGGVEFSKFLKKKGGGSDFPHKKGGADKIRVFAL